MDRYLVTQSTVIAAPAQRLFDLVADPARHPQIDGSGSVTAARAGNPPRLARGSKFGMDMRIGVPYRIRNEVVEFEEGRRIAWRHFNGHVWRWTFEPLPDGTTRVSEQWDARPARARLPLLLLGFDRRNRSGIEQSLRRLAELATEPAG